MIKQTLTYTDFNGNSQTEDFYFNLAKHELLDNMELQPRFEQLVEMIKEERSLTPDEVRSLLHLIKDLIDLSYGLRSADGKRFEKSAAHLEEFKSSSAYDEFLFSLFQDPARANDFLVGVFPADLRAKAEEKLAEESGKTKDPKDMTREELLAAMKGKIQE